jgi:signal transduction histidine kinase
MGLHIARLVAEFHQGQIRADNIKEYEGVAVTLVIPMLD